MADEHDDDPVGKQLDDQIRANEALLQGLKYVYGQRLLEAQSGGADPPPISDLLAIRRIESQLQNDKTFREARQMTRRPS